MSYIVTGAGPNAEGRQTRGLPPFGGFGGPGLPRPARGFLGQFVLDGDHEGSAHDSRHVIK
ncbi:hypothetical protein, partial [Arthrobacter sp. NPDC056493]|uniref:hypothetical protein n=1 Tax=Arthrobacter sp. NPDC056493 TaxID=3345839 RepID=UPI00366FEC59